MSAFCASSHCFRDINVSSIWSWKCRSTPRCTTVEMTLFDDKYIISYFIAVVMFAPSFTLCEIFAKIIKCQVWPWKWRSNWRWRKTGLEPFDGNVRFHIGDISLNFSWMQKVLAFKVCNLWNVGQGHDVQLSLTIFDGKYMS